MPLPEARYGTPRLSHTFTLSAFYQKVVVQRTTAWAFEGIFWNVVGEGSLLWFP